MNVRSLAALFVLALLLAGSALPGQAAEPASSPAAPAGDGSAAGGGYRIISAPTSTLQVVAVQATGSASGGRYRLESAGHLTASGGELTAAGSAEGCCCTYLPFIMR